MKAGSEKGYSVFFLHGSPARTFSTIMTFLIIGLAAGVYVWYSRVGNDPTPDSIVGYAFAFSGTTFLILAAVGFSMSRRSRKRVIGGLNGALHWHIAFAFIGLSLLFLHSFGNFNPRTGTYALYGMIALVISGFIGRTFDRLMPRLIAKEARKALTEQGEDRIESITRKLQSVVVHNTREELRAFTATPDVMVASGGRQNTTVVAPEPGKQRGGNSSQERQPQGDSAAALPTSWDLAYISLEETPQELGSDPQYRFVPDRKSALARPGALIPGAQEHMVSLQLVENALEREQFYRYIIRYWRIFHITLALTTIGLTLWHIEYALQLLIPVWLHH
ncbi:MAG TPA: hypothetical protein VKR06_25540 [Ktedonosporobacter sp.]|nr:hypothetical protein [Ktedonosporobacter sp.]